MAGRLRYLLPLLILAFFLFPLNIFAQSTNLILNHSFESGLSSWRLGGCCFIDGTYTLGTDTTTSVIGPTSLHLTSTDVRNNFWGYQVVRVEPNTNYVFAGHLKTNISFPGNAFFFIQAFSTDWQYVTFTFNSGTNTGLGVRTQLEFANGSGWFDGLRLYPTNNPGINLITNPSFEPDLSGWEFGVGIPGTYSVEQDQSTAKDGVLSLKLSSTDSRNNFWGGQLVAIEPNTDYVFSGWLKQDVSAGRVFFYLTLEPSRTSTTLGWQDTETGIRYVGAPTGGLWRHYGDVINSGLAGKFFIRSQLEWATGDVWADGLSLYKEAVPITIDVQPDPLILRRPVPPYVTAFIEVPEEFFLSEISISSVKLNGVLADPSFSNVGDYDSDGIPDLQLVFPRSQFDQTVIPGINTVVLDGLILGLPLKGTDSLTIK